MQMLDSIRKTMLVFPKSYINYNNELILIPKFNVYICLDNIISDEDFYVELCEYFSRECSSALRGSSKPTLYRYYNNNTRNFNKICNTSFSTKDMDTIYAKLGNGINHQMAVDFVKSGFDLSVLGESQ